MMSPDVARVRYLLQPVVLPVHQRLPVVVKLDVVRLDVLQRSLSQHRAVLHRYDLVPHTQKRT